MNDPEKYSVSSLPSHDIGELIVEFAPEIKNMKGKIIDIGCGPGDVTNILLQSLPSDATIDGIDISSNMVEFAVKRFKNDDRLSFFQLDIETPELPKNLLGKYENAVSFYCLHLCRDLKVTLKNIYSLLRPGGKVLIMFFTNQILFDMYLKQQKIEKFASYMEDAWNYISSYYQSPDAEEMMRKDLKEAGFQILHCSHRSKTFHHKNVESFLNLLMSVNPFIKRMPEDVREQYRSNVREEIINRYLSDEKNVDVNESPVRNEYSLIISLFQKPMLEN